MKSENRNSNTRRRQHSSTMTHNCYYRQICIALAVCLLQSPFSVSFSLVTVNTVRRVGDGETLSLSATTTMPLPNLMTWLQVHDEQDLISRRRPTHHSTKQQLQRSTRLSATTTVPPPPQHMQWLKLQDEQEKLCSRRQRRSRHKGDDGDIPVSSCGVVPMTLFAEEVNSTLSAKEAWAACFTTVEGLRNTFGRNRNIVLGDLDASTTRRLYKTLLPRALLELYHCHGVSSEDLAPMAYRARVAAKKYARERSRLPARIGASLFDGFRQFRKYGTFQASGMSYRQLWDKYATQIMQEGDFKENEESDLTSRVCYRILEKSCETNKRVDAVFLPNQEHDLHEITRKLEQEVYDLLQSKAEDKDKWAIRRYKILRTLLRIRRQMEGLTHSEDKDDDLAMQAVLEEALVDAKD